MADEGGNVTDDRTPEERCRHCVHATALGFDPDLLDCKELSDVVEGDTPAYEQDCGAFEPREQ